MKIKGKNELFLLEEIVKKNFSAKYKDSALGVIWSFLRPLLLMVILTIVFSTFFKGSVENYPVYLLAGRCVYDFFSGTVNLSMNAIYGNKNILQKTAAPKYIFVVASVISEFINFFISVLLLIGVMLVTRSSFHITILLSIIPIISLIMMVTGLGLFLSIVCVYYTDVRHLWSVFSQLIMYTSAIFYPMDIVPEPYHQYLILNPIFWIIDQFRDYFIYGILPEFLYVINSLLLSAIILVFGIIIFKKYENKVSMKF